MNQTVLRIWSLFFGLALVGLAVGVQGSLLGIRATHEGYSNLSLGLTMSAYFAGFLIGATLAPHLIIRVGHVRTYAALTALASISILIHAINTEPWMWMLMRLVTGFAISGIYVVAESWLNRASDASNRGTMLSIYMVVIFLGLSGGQFMLNIAEPSGFELFSLVSVLVSFAAVPMLMSTVPTPPLDPIEKLPLKRLVSWAPFGVFSVLVVSTCFSVIFGMGAVYATQVGLDVEETATFMAVLIGGGVVLQLPLGKLSDRYDRRIVVTIIAFVAMLLAMLSSVFPVNTVAGLAVVALFGGFCFPLYALSVALVSDYLRPEKVVAASGAVTLIAGIGSIAGPLIASVWMGVFGAGSYFWLLTVLLGCVGAFGAFRCLFNPYNPETDSHEFSMYGPTPVNAAMFAVAESDEVEANK